MIKRNSYYSMEIVDCPPLEITLDVGYNSTTVIASIYAWNGGPQDASAMVSVNEEGNIDGSDLHGYSGGSCSITVGTTYEF